MSKKKRKNKKSGKEIDTATSILNLITAILTLVIEIWLLIEKLQS